jgi:RNA polymerase sigma-70 factor, ECF subfamily
MEERATRITQSFAVANGAAVDAALVLPLIYEELRSMAEGFFAAQPREHTLQPTALVHEVWLKLARAGADVVNKQHFLALSSTAMRQVLADHARRKRSDKRGGILARVTLDEELDAVRAEFDVVAFDDALAKLSAIKERYARIVELRFLGGMSIPEVAAELAVSTRTIELDWRAARAWLLREMQGTVPHQDLGPVH